MIKRGELTALSVDPVRLDPGHVAEVLALRQVAALAKLEAERQDPLSLAVDVRRRLLFRDTGVVLPDQRAAEQQRRLGLLPESAKSLFGGAGLAAVFVEDGCRWCAALKFAARTKGMWGPTYGAAFVTLLDQEPCQVCGPGLYGAVMTSLAVRVHGGAGRPSAPPSPPSTAERARAREWALQHPVTASAKPVRPDDGRGLVQRRLRETRAQLKDARRQGDQRRVLQLAQTVRALEADAAVVDGRAAARALPGTLRCGHALAARCSCPRLGSSRGQR
ncbi:hypothetical protein P1P68_12690 [Streptomyces scabiei]|uniref:hypothetical protein n=1 Tax=Streptomyces scabiei TaxID=1930 RepID=UPI00298FCB7C|nr:hypothetical protein [Streptomyces scabiei]MDW8805616.1 hypothetical protein [Streptomyces scabiei]